MDPERPSATATALRVPVTRVRPRRPTAAGGRRRTRRRTGALLAVACAVLAACGEPDDPAATAPAGSGTTAAGAPAAVALRVVFDDGDGLRARGALTCRDGVARAGGALYRGARAGVLCERARALAGLLTEPPPGRRACTQIYGGPQTARVTGTIGGRRVERSFGRSNGCAIADWDRAAALLRP